MEMSETQDELTAAINAEEDKKFHMNKKDGDGDEENLGGLDDLDWAEEGEGDEKDKSNPEAFMVKRRQISILAVPPLSNPSKSKMDDFMKNMSEYCPKVKEISELIEKNVGKHVVYSSFVKVGVSLVEQVLINKGWINYLKLKKEGNGIPAKYKGKVYAIWSGDTKDAEKTIIKNAVNAKDNIFGDKIRVIIGSPSIKEGVSFKHIQHMHLLDAVWNLSAKDQVEGRAVRFCSHVDIKPEHVKAGLKRTVIIHVFKMIPREGGKTKKTCDQIIYDVIIPKKALLVKAGESALKKVSLDHYLFRELYPHSKNGDQKADNSPSSPKENEKVNKKWPTPTYDENGKSHIDLSDEENVLMKQKKMKKPANTCPKPRRPDGMGNCMMGYVKRENVHGDECCYKVRGKKA